MSHTFSGHMTTGHFSSHVRELAERSEAQVISGNCLRRFRLIEFLSCFKRLQGSRTRSALISLLNGWVIESAQFLSPKKKGVISGLSWYWRSKKKKREFGEMGICYSVKERVSPWEMHRDREWKDEQDERVWQVKVRLTARELKELLLQAQGGEAMGPELLSKCIMKGRLEIRELAQGDDCGRRQKKMSKLEAIEEEEI